MLSVPHAIPFHRVDLRPARSLRCACSERWIWLCVAVPPAEDLLSDWKFAQKDVSEELALLHSYSMKKHQNNSDVCFVITVKEFAAPPPGQYARFFAQADKYVNQKTAPLLPTGWGNSILDALCACARMIREFPYEGQETREAKDSSET
jgi:hypothetical protein